MKRHFYYLLRWNLEFQLQPGTYPMNSIALSRLYIVCNKLHRYTSSSSTWCLDILTRFTSIIVLKTAKKVHEVVLWILRFYWLNRKRSIKLLMSDTWLLKLYSHYGWEFSLSARCQHWSQIFVLSMFDVCVACGVCFEAQLWLLNLKWIKFELYY